MAITQSNLAQLTARSGILRAGTGRSAAAPPTTQLKASSAEIIWNRPPATDGNPDDTADTWTTVRE